MSEIEQNLELEPVNTEEPEEKPKLTPEQELGIKRRNFSRLAQELGVEVAKPWIKPEAKPEPKPVERTSFDDTEQLFLDVKQVPNEERDWLFNEHKTTGKPLRELMNFNYVSEHLKTQADSRKSEAALPEAKNRSGVPASNTVDYWDAKVKAGLSIREVPDVNIRKQIDEKRYKEDRKNRGRF